MASLTLYTDSFWISPYVFTAFVALKEKGVEFVTEPIALDKNEQLEASFRDRSITARVPALAHEGFVVAESSAIVEYLDEAFPDRPLLLPEDLHDRARARQVLAWIRSDLSELREERPTTTMFYDHATKPLSAKGEAAAAKLLRVAEALLPQGGTTLFGAWSIADSDLAFMLHRLILNGHPVPSALEEFAAAQWARPSVRAFVVRERPPFVAY